MRRGSVRRASFPSAANRRRRSAAGCARPSLARDRTTSASNAAIILSTNQESPSGSWNCPSAARTPDCKCVGHLELRGGLRVKTTFIKDGRQAKPQESHGAGGQGLVADQPLDRLDLGVGEPASEGDGQPPVRLSELGTQSQRRACRLARLLDLPALCLNLRQPNPRRGHHRIEAQRLAEAGLGLVVPALPQERHTLFEIGSSRPPWTRSD